MVDYHFRLHDSELKSIRSEPGVLVLEFVGGQLTSPAVSLIFSGRRTPGLFALGQLIPFVVSHVHLFEDVKPGDLTKVLGAKSGKILCDLIGERMGIWGQSGGWAVVICANYGDPFVVAGEGPYLEPVRSPG